MIWKIFDGVPDSKGTLLKVGLYDDDGNAYSGPDGGLIVRETFVAIGATDIDVQIACEALCAKLKSELDLKVVLGDNLTSSIILLKTSLGRSGLFKV